MKAQIKDLPKSQKEITVEISAGEMEKYMDKAVNKLSLTHNFDGFRQGKAPRNIIEQQLGRYKVFEEASRIAIEDSYSKIVRDNNLEPIGQPKAEITKIAFGNPFEYKVTISVMPEVKLGDYKKVSGKMEVKEVNDEKVEKEIKTLQKKRASYLTKDEPAQKGDRVEIDFISRIGGVKIEGGESKNHPLVIGGNKFVAGFEDNLVGMKKNEEKKFNVIFPQDYYKKDLAGKNVDFEVKMKIVQKVKLPELNDEFAKSLGKFESLDNLKKSIKGGLVWEEEARAKEILRNDLIEQVCNKSEFEVPEVLIEAEINNMINELKNNIMQIGLGFETYLQNTKTTKAKLREEWKNPAEKRVKTNLVIREISTKENIKASDEEIEEKINHTLKHYSNENEVRKNINMEKFRDYIAAEIVNEKVFNFLEKIAKVNSI